MTDLWEEKSAADRGHARRTTDIEAIRVRSIRFPPGVPVRTSPLTSEGR